MQSNKPLAFCESCYEDIFDKEKLEHCKSLNHDLTSVDKKLTTGFVNGKSFIVRENKKEVHIELLDHSIQTLRPITMLENETKMILVYLPTKTTIQKDEEDPTFDHKAFFVIHEPDKQKRILPINDKEFKENYKIQVLPIWNDSRWNKKDIDLWLEEKEPTNPTKLYEMQLKDIKKYFDFENERDYVYLTLWNIHTYFFELFDATAYNDLTGTKRAGKSKVLEYQKHVCFNAIMTADITSSATFRIIEGLGATVLLDESEQFKNKNNENAQQVRTLLNQGFLKDQYAIRSEGKANEGFRPVTFNLFSPKSLAHINGFDDVLEDRCIKQLMRRSKNKDMLNTWPERTNPVFQKIRNLSYRLFLDYGNEISHLEKEAKDLLSISGRELKLWMPIITLALFFEKHGVKGLIPLIQEKSQISSKDRQIQDEQENYDLQILRFCDDIGIRVGNTQEEIKKNPLGWIPLNVLYKHLTNEETSQEYGINIEYYSNKKLSGSLSRLGFKRDRKISGYSWLITRKEVDDVKERMGMMEVKEDLKLGSLPSLPSLPSFSDVNSKSENEPNEHNEPNEPKVRPTINTNENEHNEHNELD